MVVLAAGGSARLGHPKQLVPYHGEPLLRRAARTAIETGAGPVLVMLGASADDCRPALEGLEVRVLVHEGWAEGVGSTVAAAVCSLQDDPDTHAILFVACDQPRVTSADLEELLRARAQHAASAAAADYAGTFGVPAVFARSHFPALAQLRGSQGARSVLRHALDVVRVPIPGAAFDLDTPADLSHLDVEPGSD